MSESQNENIHTEVMNEIARVMQSVAGKFQLELPPKAFKHMDGRIHSYVRKKELTASFYCNPEFSNPQHVLQGGFMAAAIDNTMGPLSYLATGRATTTLELSVNYIRMAKEGQRITVTARVIVRGTQHLYMEAEVKGEDDKELARATSTILILPTPPSK